MDKLKEFWTELKADYENKYKIPFLTDYDKSVPYFEKMEELLLDMQKEEGKNVEIACLLASVRMELRDSYEDCAELLLDFLGKNEEYLSDNDKARLYTNIGYYSDFETLTPKYLLKAEELNSPYPETYEGLGLYYFSEYESDNDEKNLEKALKYFEKTSKMSNDYASLFNYGAALYENKEYKEAKILFENLLIEYPNRMRLLLSVGYCELFMGNKEKALFYLAQVKDGQDENYSLSTDDISDYQVYDAYYVLDEYDKFLNGLNDVICKYYTDDWEHYYYTLWIKNQKDKFYDLVQSTVSKLEDSVEEAKIDEDYNSQEEKEEYIASYKEDLAKYKAMIKRIEDGCKKPEIKLSLYPEYKCFLIDCLRHKF